MNGFERRKELIKEKIKKTVLDMLKTWEPKKYESPILQRKLKYLK